MTVVSAVAGASLTLADNGNITTTGSIKASTIKLETIGGTNGAIAADGGLGLSTSVDTIETDGGNVTTKTSPIIGTSLTLNSPSGSYGTSSASQLVTTVKNLTVSSGTNAFIKNSATGTTVFNASAVSGTFALTNAGAVNVTGALSANAVSITATGQSISLGAGITSATSLTLVARH